MKKYNSILFKIALIILSISFGGCYSFNNIPQDEYVSKEVERSLKSYSNSEWETDMLRTELRELETELNSLGY